MIRRSIAIFLLLQQALWLLMILPGHKRGEITVAGYDGAASCHEPAVRDCCSTSPSHKGCDHSKGPADRAAHCAVCFHALRMMPASLPDFVPPPVGLAEQLPPQPAFLSPAIPVVLAFDACGPPAIG